MIGGKSKKNVLVLTLVVVGNFVTFGLNRSNRRPTWMYFILSAFIKSF